MSISEDILDRSSIAHYGEAAASISCYRSDNSASSSSKCGGGTATSHRYQPNSHHRVVASAYINSHVASAPSMYTESYNHMGDFKYTQADTYLPVRQSSMASSAQYELNFMPGHMPYLSHNHMHSTSIASSGTSKKACQENAIYFGQQHSDVRNRISGPKRQRDNQSYWSLAKNNQPLLVEKNSIQLSDAQNNANDQSLRTNLFTTSTQFQKSTYQSGYETSTGADQNIISAENTPDKKMNFLCLYRHAVSCSACSIRDCSLMKALIGHISRCCGCSRKGCILLKKIIDHYHECKDSNCVRCLPVKKNLENKLHEIPTSNTFANSVCNDPMVNGYENHEPPLKRARNETSLLKIDHYRECKDSSVICLPVKRNRENKLCEIPTSNTFANSVCNDPMVSGYENHEPPLKRARNEISLLRTDHYHDCKDSDCVICLPVKTNLENKLHEIPTSNTFAYSVCNDLMVNGYENHEPPLKRARNETSLLRVDHYRECKDSNGVICLPVEENLENKLHEISTSSTFAKSVCNDPMVSGYENHEPPLNGAKNETSLVLHNVEGHFVYTPTVSNDKKTHEHPLSDNNETSLASMLVKDSPGLSTKADKEKYEELTTALNSKPESMELDKGPSSNSSEESMSKARIGDILGNGAFLEVKDAQQEKEQLHVMVEPDELEVDKCSSVATESIHEKDHISIFDLLTLQQTKDHLKSLRKPVDQTEEKAEKNQGKGSEIDINTCSLCREQKLFYEPPIRCCAVCLRIISKGIYYYNSNESDSSVYFCRTCFQTPGENITASDRSFSKANLCKGENNPEASDLEEWWVECDKCKSWQHQTCALFNPVKYKATDVFHTCPDCLIQEVDSGEYDQVAQSKELKAKDLQTTKLSDHLEKWIYRCLEEERLERADHMGKEFSEVPTAEGLVVRVVSSVAKKVEVKKVVQDIIKNETYPSELLYRSKAIALFQNIDGADVCLFIMYVQEYGSDCAEPNKNLLCISYLDSVKHFTPDIKTISGEALRTFVYHQIIIGYLYYNKMLGFVGAYIWASPPRKRNDDYILNCHPKVQKVPKPDILRAWYHTMTRKATKAEIVIEHTNLYDRFFAKSTESATTITAAHLPYFDGDYWPGLAEQLLTSGEVAKCQNNAAADRVLRAYRRESITGNEQDILFMHNLGEKIRPVKEDLMMVYLHHVCKHCCNSILSGNAWLCSTCKKFQLCEECYQIQQNLAKKERHPVGRNEEHTFHKIEVDKISQGASEDEANIEHDIFDTRLSFLEFCQQNHYQFDTLRRAKHSTMMILYHLHNPKSQKHELAHTDHHNKQLSIVNNQIQFHQIKQELKFSSAFWSHTSNCSSSSCTYKYCYKMRKLFYHARHCKTRASSGCEFCQRAWQIISIHAQSCIQRQCCVPRCNDLKDWTKKKSQKAGSNPNRRAKGKARMKSRIRRRKNG